MVFLIDRQHFFSNNNYFNHPQSGYHNFFTIHYYLLLQSPKGVFSEE